MIKMLTTLLRPHQRQTAVKRPRRGAQTKYSVLDEPPLDLDTQTRNLLWSYVQRLNREHGMTAFFTTHYLEEAEAVAPSAGNIVY